MSDVSTMKGSSALPKPSPSIFSDGFSWGAASRGLSEILPGIILAALIAAAAILTSRAFGGPVMLYALVIGMFLNPIGARPRVQAGLSFSADSILKIGVALLGLKITIIDVANLGWQTAVLVMAGVTVTMFVGTAIGRMFGLKSDHAVMSAGSVAICGSSAALAISAALPQTKNTECNTVMTVMAVTTLSTIAMVLYPVIANLLSLSDAAAGIFMGVSIHNVAQVVGAGYMVSGGAGEVATIVKLMRVACLMPVIIIISLMFRKPDGDTSGIKRPPLLPLFMIGFVFLMLINSLGYVPAKAGIALGNVSHWALVIAVAALGVKTSVKDIVAIGIAPIKVLVLQTIMLAAFTLTAIIFVLAI